MCAVRMPDDEEQTGYNTTSNNESNPRAYSTGTSVDCEKMNEGVDGLKSVGEDKQRMEEEDPFYINTVRLRKEKKERLRVTVEITHNALRLPAYLTWTGT